jgi:hypothetical protein
MIAFAMGRTCCVAVELLTDDAFEALPENTSAPKTDEFWDPILRALGERKIVKISFATDKEKRGRRIAAGRRSKKAGFVIEIRYGDDFLAVRRANDSGTELTQDARPIIGEKSAQPPPRRRSKTTTDD